MNDNHETDADAIIELATSAAEGWLVGPQVIDPAELHSLILPHNMGHQLLDMEKHLAAPRRAKGTVAIHDPASLVAYVKKHIEGEHTALYANIDDSTITAVLNGHAEPAEGAGWGDHRAVFTARQTPEWKFWTSKNLQWMGQAAFAEHIEAGQAEITDPPAGEMLDLAQTLVANVGVDFTSQSFLANGQRQFKYEETVIAHAGAQGTMKIPGQFTLGIRVYDAEGDFYKMIARLQFRIEDRALKMRYLLDRPHDILRAAFNDVIAGVEKVTEMTAYRGVAPASQQ